MLRHSVSMYAEPPVRSFFVCWLCVWLRSELWCVPAGAECCESASAPVGVESDVYVVSDGPYPPHYTTYRVRSYCSDLICYQQKGSSDILFSHQIKIF